MFICDHQAVHAVSKEVIIERRLKEEDAARGPRNAAHKGKQCRMLMCRPENALRDFMAAGSAVVGAFPRTRFPETEDRSAVDGEVGKQC